MNIFIWMKIFMAVFKPCQYGETKKKFFIKKFKYFYIKSTQSYL